MVNKFKDKQTAKRQIEELFKDADKVFSKDKNLANKRIKLARRIAMKFNIRLRSELKRKFCKHCYSYLKPGINLRTRLKDKKIVYYCLECKKFTRFPYKK